MPKVVTFSVFFPSVNKNSAVCAHPKLHQEHSNAASIFLMITPLQRYCMHGPAARRAAAVRTRASIGYRLVDQRVHQPPVVPADRTGRRGHENDDELLL